MPRTQASDHSSTNAASSEPESPPKGETITRTSVITETSVMKSTMKTVNKRAANEAATRTPTQHRVSSMTQRSPAPSTPGSFPRQASTLQTPSRSPPSTGSLGYPAGIPHPRAITIPTSRRIKKFYVITVGQEVGIFFNWNDVGQRVNYISGALHQSYNTFQEALDHYTDAYERGELRIKVLPNSRFGAGHAAATSQVDNFEDVEYWQEVDDLLGLVNSLNLA
ncbi:hypothetical protein HYDPIDRAFT_33819 [Hydnomerulius pinastri MD-312]|uniref:Ribonuclease H1 N-terminal domain-containing protein n=1 Tax=Hydnomerulius pinastri MD-312 TaxID=994086 RepID=A0A0C9W7H1_9AGAM|nr:hypothetical protein HYDPIDRAFT_33819 [Hydnomerulius pinastri MD-312]